MIVTSFYTPDWEYPTYAARLSNDCDRLGLKHHIVKRQSHNDYVKNCNIKPFFLKEMLEKFKSPIFWMDVDGRIVDKPKLLLTDNIKNYDIAANRPVWNSNRIHVGSM